MEQPRDVARVVDYLPLSLDDGGHTGGCPDIAAEAEGGGTPQKERRQSSLLLPSELTQTGLAAA